MLIEQYKISKNIGITLKYEKSIVNTRLFCIKNLIIMKKKILFVSTHFPPDYPYGGLIESGSKLLTALRKIQPNITAVSVSKNPKKVLELSQKGDLCCRSNFYHDWGISIELIYALWGKIKNSDIIYINGIVTFPVTLATIYALLHRKKIIVSTHGSLEPWSVNHKKWKKYFYYKFIVLPLINRCDKVHVSAEMERDNVKQYGVKPEAIVIPNGVNLEEYREMSPSLKQANPFNILFLSRISKKKGLDILIESFNEFLEKYPNSNAILQLVGPDNENYVAKLNIKNNVAIKYLGTAYGNEKKQLYANANLFVLPTYSENFGIVIAEAMACGCPIITTTGTPWQIIETINCGKFINPNKEELLNALTEIYHKTNQERLEMGINGRRYVYENLDWDQIGSSLFKQIVNI